MIKILKPGKIQKFTMTCPDCGCVFEYEPEDLLLERMPGGVVYTTLPPQYDWVRYVVCPNCHKKLKHDQVVGFADGSNLPGKKPSRPDWPPTPLEPMFSWEWDWNWRDFRPNECGDKFPQPWWDDIKTICVNGEDVTPTTKDAHPKGQVVATTDDITYKPYKSESK